MLPAGINFNDLPLLDSGDVILNRTSNNDPFRWDGAAWTAM